MTIYYKQIALPFLMLFALTLNASAQDNSISSTEDNFTTSTVLTEEQRMMKKFTRNSQRKFGPRIKVSSSNAFKNDLIKAENQRRIQQLRQLPTAQSWEIDTTECHHHPKHVLKINTFGVFSGDFVEVKHLNKDVKPFYLGLGAVQLTLKTEENGWWKGGALSLFVANTHGDNPSADDVGDLQVFDNIEAPNPRTWTFGKKYGMPNRSFFYEFYYQQVIKNFRFLIGQSDLNYDFQYSNYGANFLNSSFGISPEVTVNLPTYSTYPFTAFGIRADYKLGDFFLRGAIAQGNPGNHISNQYNFDFRLDGQYGAFLIGELEYEKMYSEDVFLTNLRAGIWHHTSQFQVFTDTTQFHSGNTGFYFIGEQLLYGENADKTQGLGAFIQTGWAPGDHNVINSYVGGGLCYTGLIKNRDSDILAVAIANPFYNTHLTNDGHTNIERAIEMNYTIAFNDNISLTPCVQFLTNPAFVDTGDNPVVFMCRLSIRGGELYNNR